MCTRMYSVEIDLFIMKAEDVLFRVAMRFIISVRERGEDATAEIASEIQKPGVNRSDDYPVGRCLPRTAWGNLEDVLEISSKLQLLIN